MDPELYVTPRGDELLVVIAGDVDDIARLDAVLERQPLPALRIDASGVTFAGSRFLAWLVRARDEAGLRFDDVSPAVRDLLNVTGMTGEFEGATS